MKSVQIEKIFGPYFSVFELNTGIYGVNSVFSPNTTKYEPEKTPHLNTFQTVWSLLSPRVTTEIQVQYT